MLGSLVFTLDTDGAVFKLLAEIVVPFTDEDQAAAKDGRPENVTVLSWDAVSETWIDTYALLDIINDTLTVSSTTLGTYAVVITLPDEVEETPTPMPVVTETPAVVMPEDPDGGDYGVGNSMMMGLALLGMLFLVGGGYVLVRNRR